MQLVLHFNEKMCDYFVKVFSNNNYLVKYKKGLWLGLKYVCHTHTYSQYEPYL